MVFLSYLILNPPDSISKMSHYLNPIRILENLSILKNQFNNDDKFRPLMIFHIFCSIMGLIPMY